VRGRDAGEKDWWTGPFVVETDNSFRWAGVGVRLLMLHSADSALKAVGTAVDCEVVAQRTQKSHRRIHVRCVVTTRTSGKLIKSHAENVR